VADNAPLACAQKPQLAWSNDVFEDVLTRAVVMEVQKGAPIKESPPEDVTKVIPGITG
jgi:hypothetical protein